MCPLAQTRERGRRSKELRENWELYSPYYAGNNDTHTVYISLFFLRFVPIACRHSCTSPGQLPMQHCVGLLPNDPQTSRKPTQPPLFLTPAGYLQTTSTRWTATHGRHPSSLSSCSSVVPRRPSCSWQATRQTSSLGTPIDLFLNLFTASQVVGLWLLPRGRWQADHLGRDTYAHWPAALTQPRRCVLN